MRQFQRGRLDFEFLRINRLICSLGLIAQQCLNQIGHLLFSGRI